MKSENKNGMNDSEHPNGVPAEPGGWSKPQGLHIPEPTYMPLVMALGIMCLLWGIVTTAFLSLVGAILFVVAISGWIGELRHEHRHSGAK